MNENAQKLFDYLKTSGKVSGGTAKAELDFKDSEYRKAKEELNNAGVVILGRGRGGTIELVDGAQPPKEPKKLSRAEIMAAAREEKESRSKQKKFHDESKAHGKKIAAKEFPENDTEVHIVKVDYNGGWAEYHIWVWGDNKKAKPYKGFYEQE
jgi:hypothetical protein